MVTVCSTSLPVCPLSQLRLFLVRRSRLWGTGVARSESRDRRGAGAVADHERERGCTGVALVAHHARVRARGCLAAELR